MKSPMNALRGAVVAVALAVGAPVVTATPQAQAAVVDTVPGAQAAEQLRLGMSDDQTPEKARESLGTLTVRAAGSMEGYSRTKFPHWKTASAHGWTDLPNSRCNVRNAALLRDGENVEVSSRCTQATGTWVDPYTAKRYDSASDIDIDHVVPLANAWRSGADDWDLDRRTDFANDPLVVLSVQDAANQAKGDKGPEAWKPANKASHCLYATRWVSIKAKYQLSVNPAEKSSLNSMLATCR